MGWVPGWLRWLWWRGGGGTPAPPPTPGYALAGSWADCQLAGSWADCQLAGSWAGPAALAGEWE